jgi:nucleotide-binding universal stress UspA family protein
MSTNGWDIAVVAADAVDTANDQGRATKQRNDVVVGIDDSPSAASALLWAADYARTNGLPLRVVHAWQLSAAASAAVAAGDADYFEAVGADARARATRFVLDVLGRSAAEIRWTLDVGEGGAGQVLVHRSRDAQLLVVGTREHTGLRRAVGGSVSHYCLSHAEVPVLAVPSPDAHSPDTGRRQMASPAPLL